MVRRPGVSFPQRKSFAAVLGEARTGAHFPSNRPQSRTMSDLPRPLEQRGLELVGHSDLDGRGDGMQIMRKGDVLYVGHMGDFAVGTSVVDIADLSHPRVARQIGVPKGTHSHKVQLANGLPLA